MIEKIYSPLVDVLHRLENIALISALISMLGIAVLQIFLRNFFDSGFLWAESFLRILVGCIRLEGDWARSTKGPSGSSPSPDSAVTRSKNLLNATRPKTTRPLAGTVPNRSIGVRTGVATQAT